MAISAPTKSVQYTNLSAAPPVLNSALDLGATVTVFSKLTFTAAGFTTAAAGDLQLQRMPPGHFRILHDLCRVICPVGTATSDLDIGYGAYVNEAGTAVAADGDAFAASLDVGGGAINTTFTTGAVTEIESKSGWDLVASFDTANSPAAGDLIVIVVMQKAS